MKISRDQSTFTGSDTGVSPLVVSIDSDYTENQITITGLATGTMTVKYKAQGGDVLETFTNNTLDLTTARTIKLEGLQLEEIELSVAPAAAYNYRIEQW